MSCIKCAVYIVSLRYTYITSLREYTADILATERVYTAVVYVMGVGNLWNCSSSSSVDQLDTGRRPLCPIHYVDPFLNQIKSNIS